MRDLRYGGWAGFIVCTILMSLLVAVLSGSLLFRRAAREGDPLEVFVSRMGEHIPALMAAYRIPGTSIALVKDSEIVWLQGFGYADVTNRRALTPETPMSVQSISKSVTAWGVLSLVEKSQISLDGDVSSYLGGWEIPRSEFSAAGVTVGRLLSHTAGMPLGDFTQMYHPEAMMPSLRERLTQEAILISEPGTGFSYSNTGYNLLELVVEEAAGQDFADYMRSEVLLPLGMNASSFKLDDLVPWYPPTGYDLGGKPVPVYVYPEKASGGLFATAEDIAKFAMSYAKENPVLSATSINTMCSPKSTKMGIYSMVFDAYGFGHYIETLKNGLRSLSHGGQGSGIMTHFQVVPESGDAIVILTNSQRSWPLISTVLGDWARWRSFPTVGMGRIILAQYALSAIIGLLLSTSLFVVATGLRADRRALCSITRVSLATGALASVGAVIWCAHQPYFILASLFPVLTVWLGAGITVLSAATLFALTFPCTRTKSSQSRG